MAVESSTVQQGGNVGWAALVGEEGGVGEMGRRGRGRKSNMNTVFPRSNAAATIYFITRFTAATIRGRPLIEGGVY